MPTMKNSGTKKFVNAPDFFLPLTVVRRGRFAAVFVLRAVPRFCIAIISLVFATENTEKSQRFFTVKTKDKFYLMIVPFLDFPLNPLCPLWLNILQNFQNFIR